jgi:dienelactone hydrolase
MIKGGLSMRNSLLHAVGYAALVSAAQPAIAAAPLAEDAKAFGTREQVRTMAMSPDGSKVAMLTSAAGSVTVLQVADLRDGSVRSLTNSDGRPQSLHWCNFAGNSQLVCQYGGVEPYEDVLVGFSRLMTIRTDGKAMRALGQKASAKDAYLRQSDGSIVDWLAASDGQILMARNYVPEINTTGSILGRSKDGLGIDRLDLATMKSTMVEGPRPRVDRYMSDGLGLVRLYTASDRQGESGLLTGTMRIKFRRAGSTDWRDLGTYDSRDDTGYYPLAIDADTDSLYALKDVAGRDTLVRVKLDGSGAETAVAANAKVDIDNVVRLGAGNRVIGYTYADDRRHHVYFDREYNMLQTALSKAIPKMPLIDFVGASADGKKMLIYASGDTAPGMFYRYDKESRNLEEIAAVRPHLAGRTLSPVTSIRVVASDGTQIPAYLTIPAGSSGKDMPAVVLPHGGPSARDEWGFDWLAQFLAARGYVVIQPNYRGSAGYGDEFLAKNGFQGWRTSIGDVTSAARHLVAQGIADPKRMAIVGWSYGGYAALQSVATEPTLYQAAVAVAPVTDLALLKQQFEQYTDKNLGQSFVGSGPHIIEGSPLRNASKITVPVLLAHGNRDLNVNIAQSEKMESALRGAGRPVEYLRFKGLDHQLDDSTARIELLMRIGALLERTIGH